MKRLTSLAVVVLGFALPACAQHGGGASHGGGGFSAHSAPAFHSSPSFRPSGPSASSGFRSAPGYAARYPMSRPAGSVRSYGTPGPVYPYAYSASSAHRGVASSQYKSGQYENGRPPYRRPYRSPYGYGYPYGVGYTLWPAPYYLDSGYADGYDDSGDSIAYGDQSAAPYANDPQYQPVDPSYQPQYQPGYGPGPYATPPPDPSAAGSNFGSESAPTYRPDYEPSAAPLSPPPATQPAITLVFKDNHPAEKIHNYLISRDTITVWDQKPGLAPREIPISQLNVLATEKANRDAGVDFYLPREFQ